MELNDVNFHSIWQLENQIIIQRPIVLRAAGGLTMLIFGMTIGNMNKPSWIDMRVPKRWLVWLRIGVFIFSLVGRSENVRPKESFWSLKLKKKKKICSNTHFVRAAWVQNILCQIFFMSDKAYPPQNWLHFRKNYPSDIQKYKTVYKERIKKMGKYKELNFIKS